VIEFKQLLVKICMHLLSTIVNVPLVWTLLCITIDLDVA